MVHQIIPNFVPGDASAQAALHLQRLFRRLGHAGDIYALETDPRLTGLIKPAQLLRPNPTDWVLYHHGIVSPLSGRMLHIRCRRGLVYHNITPARFFEGTPLYEPLRAGRAQLKAMASHLELAIADSHFNAQELLANGYRNVHVVPLFVEPERFAQEQADARELARLRQNGPVVTAVGRIVPNKRFEDVLSLYAELVRIRPQARLVIAGGYDAGSRYFTELRRRARELNGVEFLGKVPHARLVAAYRAASIFVSMSEHEGFGVPLVEAMAAEVPVMAYAAAAVPEIMGGSGVLFSEKHFAFLAELANELIGPSALRKTVLRAQERRLRSFSAERSLQTLSSIFSGRARSKLKKQRRRLAIVVQRYGAVVGGAELLARWIAERLSARWKVTVLTTCARDHLSWANEFPAGERHEGPVRVLRFASERPRHLPSFNALSRQLYARSTELVEEERWLAEQGPLVPGLWRYIDEHQRDFDAFIFFTYLYSSTVWGLPLVARRAILVPTAHDEPPLRFGIYRETFSLPSALLCSTPEERALIHHRFPGHARTRLAGVGVEVRPGSPSRFRKSFQVSTPYLMYVGRIEAGKGLPELLRCYAALRRELTNPPALLLAGAGEMRIEQEGVRCLGPISERDKFDGISGAAAVVVPSRYESLSLLALEAFSQGTPVLANAESDVLMGQVRRSGAGMTYQDPRSFVTATRRVIAERTRLGQRGISYARRHSWKRVLDVYEEELGRIARESQ